MLQHLRHHHHHHHHLSSTLFTISLLSHSSGVTITSLMVPSILPSIITTNHTRSVTLDCTYTYTREEQDSLVVEWFYNNQNTPFYRLTGF